MFDWPDASQTSPISTSLMVISLLALTVIVCGPVAASFSSLSDHLPSAPAFADCFWPAMLTVTASLGSAQPQTGTAPSRWRTM